MNMISNTATCTNAIIYLKNGKRKYGLLMTHTAFLSSYPFIPNEKINSFFTANDTSCIEHLSSASIEAIDIDLK